MRALGKFLKGLTGFVAASALFYLACWVFWCSVVPPSAPLWPIGVLYPPLFVIAGVLLFLLVVWALN